MEDIGVKSPEESVTVLGRLTAVEAKKNYEFALDFVRDSNVLEIGIGYG